MKKILFLLVFLFSLSVYGNEKKIYKNLFCSQLLWGFDFTSNNKVNVISTDLNNKTEIKEYYYETDPKIPFINIYLIEENLKNNAFSINHQTYRVDIWTMTSGGNTVRELIPKGFCKEIEIDNLVNYINKLKK